MRHALIGYMADSGMQMGFDLEAATKLTATPDKPNSARSVSKVQYGKDIIGDLFVIAFAPYDGTGDDKTLHLPSVDIAPGYPRTPKILPRSKAGIHSEVHLPLLAIDSAVDSAEPDMLYGRYDLIGLDQGVVGKIGWLVSYQGMPLDRSSATYTVGYDYDRYRSYFGGGVRFGDPHAVYNPSPNLLQVCGFIALTNEQYENTPGALQSLSPNSPLPNPR